MSTDKRDEALKQALEALDFFDPPCADSIRKILAHAPTEREQPTQQEPVGTVKELFTQAAWERLDLRGSTEVYTSPQPIKPWAWLTDEEIEQCMKQAYATVQGRNLEHAFAHAIEAKLREKNS